jgi:hypothetical protein
LGIAAGLTLVLFHRKERFDIVTVSASPMEDPSSLRLFAVAVVVVVPLGIPPPLLLVVMAGTAPAMVNNYHLNCPIFQVALFLLKE